MACWRPFSLVGVLVPEFWFERLGCRRQLSQSPVSMRNFSACTLLDVPIFTRTIHSRDVEIVGGGEEGSKEIYELVEAPQSLLLRANHVCAAISKPIRAPCLWITVISSEQLTNLAISRENRELCTVNIQ